MTHAVPPRTAAGQKILALAAVIVLVAASAMAVISTPRPARAADFTVGDTALVNTDALNLREAPGLDAGVVTVLVQGDVAVVTDGPETADDYTWYALELDDGTSGWAASDFLDLLGAIDPGFATGDGATVSYGALNLRADAGLAADIVSTMPVGTAVTILDGPVTVDDLPWYQVDAGDLGEGWSVAGFLTAGGEAPGGAFGIGASLVVDAIDGLNLRDAPGLAGGVIDLLPSGAVVTVVDGPVASDGYAWYQIETDLGTGWSAGEFLIAAGTAIAAGDQVEVIDGDLNLRAGTGLAAEIIDVMPEGAVLEVVDGPVEADGYTWFAVTSDEFGDGWAAGQFLRATTTATTEAAEVSAAGTDAETEAATVSATATPAPDAGS